MAIFHFNITMISRNKGRSSVAAAARHACEKLYDNRLGKVVRIIQKHNLIFKEILLPQNAPSWMTEREKLWNAVEAREIRKDATLAREIGITLPHELTKEQNINLAKEYVRNEFVQNGMIADLCLHSDYKDHEEQSHMHIMLTTRIVTSEGFGLKERIWNARENATLWRKSWAEHANRYLALNGIDQKIDHRSYAEQGINLIPQGQVGVQKNLKDRERRLEKSQRIARENGNRLLQDPTIALKAISLRQKAFTQLELAKFITCYTADADQFELVYAKVKTAKQIISLGQDKYGIERFSFHE